MKNIISHLFNGQLRDLERSFKNTLSANQQRELIDCEKALIQSFTIAQKNLFSKYEELALEQTSMNIEESFVNGFKMGLCFGLELADYSPISTDCSDDV